MSFDLNIRGRREEGTLRGSFTSSCGRLCFCHADNTTTNDFGLLDHPNAVLIRLLLVHKEHRGQGYGTELIKEFLERASQWGYECVLVGAWPIDDRGLGRDENEPGFKATANRLCEYYRRFGFECSVNSIDKHRLHIKLKK